MSSLSAGQVICYHIFGRIVFNSNDKSINLAIPQHANGQNQVSFIKRRNTTYFLRKLCIIPENDGLSLATKLYMTTYAHYKG